MMRRRLDDFDSQIGFFKLAMYRTLFVRVPIVTNFLIPYPVWYGMDDVKQNDASKQQERISLTFSSFFWTNKRIS